MIVTKHRFPFIIILLLILAGVSCKDNGDEVPEPEGVHLSIDGGSITPTSIRLVWTRSDSAIFKSYEVYFSRSHGFIPSASTRYGATDQRDETAKVVDNLMPSSRYYFKVRLVMRDDRVADSNEETARTADLPATESIVRFIHASSSLSTMIVKIDGATTDTLILFGNSPYRIFFAGAHGISLYQDALKIDSATIDFIGNFKASLFIIDKPTSTASRFSFRAERYTYAEPTLPDTALVRFVDASLSLGVASLHIGSPGGQFVGSNVAFGRASAYAHIAGGDYSVFVTQGDDTTMVRSSSAFTLSNDRRYTIAAIDSSAMAKLKSFVDD